MKRLYHLLSISLSLLLVSRLGLVPLMAQRDKASEIQLILIDKETKEAIISAVVAYGTSAGELKEHCLSDLDGKALIKVKENKPCYYQISAMGYHKYSGQVRPKQSAKTLTIRLSSKSKDLKELVVRGQHQVKPLKLSPVVTQVLSGEKLVDTGYGNLQQALMRETPGMNIQKVGFGNDMNMQGLDARHILFLMDGERMTGEMAGNLDYERFNLHAIDRVEIVKGASSTLYGSRASGAVINLITKKTDRPLAVAAGVRWEQMNERNYKDISTKDFLYMFEDNSDRPNLQAWASIGAKKGIITSQTDIWYSSADAYYMYQKENDSKTYTQSANPELLKRDTTLISPLKRPPLGVSGSEHISLAQKVYVEPYKWLNLELYGTAFFMNTYDLVQDLAFSQSKDYTMGARLKLGDIDYLSATLTLHTDFYDRYKRHERRDVRKQVYDSNIFSPRLVLKSNYFKGHNLVGGVDYIQDDLTSDRFAVSDKMLTRGLKEWEFYLQDNYTISDRWSCELGVRSNYSKPFGLMALPKIAVKYKPLDYLSLRANYAMGFRSPSIKELFFNWDHLAMFRIVGDNKLQPEKNNYFSLGVEYDKDAFFLSANAYANFFTKKIEGVWRVYEFQYNFEYENLKDQRLLGLDLLARWRINKAFMLNLSYSYVDVEDSHVGKISTTSPHAATAGLNYRYQRGNDYKLNIGLNTAFTGSKSFDVQDNLTIKRMRKLANGTTREESRSHKAYFRCDLPAYMLCDLNVMQIFYGKYYLSCGVKNLFNYVPKTLGSGVTMFNIPATAGRRAFIQLEYRF